MFICKNCKSVDKFELMFDPSYKGDRHFEQKYNDKNEIEITVDGYKFVPDLQFVNTADKYICGITIIKDKL